MARTDISSVIEAASAADLAIKVPCRVATTAPITLSGYPVIDGKQTVAFDRVLVKDQLDGRQNAIYVVPDGGGNWTRATDFSHSDDVINGTCVRIREGNTNAGRWFGIATANPIDLGNSAISFTDLALVGLTQVPMVVTNVAALKSLSGTQLTGQVQTLGYYTSGDGGSGLYFWNAAATTADNGGTVIAPNAGTGRWNLIYSGGLNVKSFGAKGDGTTNDAAAIQAAINSLTNGGIVFFPPGVYKCTAQISIPAGIPIVLCGSGIADYTSGAPTGTEIRSTLRDGVSPAVKVDGSVLSAGFDFSQFSMENMTLSGGTYDEVVTGGIGQGGAALGNFVGLHLKNRHQATLRYVRIIGFDQDGLRLDNSFYFAAYSSVFQHNGTHGVLGITANVSGFYNCHFQYNTFGSKNITATNDCAWEGNWKSGAKFDAANFEAAFYKPYFEANNASNTAGEADINASSSDSILIDSPYFASGGTYSAKPAATYNFTGSCTRLHVTGAMRVFNASPQNYPLFNLVGSTIMWDSTGSPHAFANYVSFTSSGGYEDKVANETAVTLTTATLSHFGYQTVKLNAAGAINLDNIDPAARGAKLVIQFQDANVTARDDIGNLRLTANMTGTSNDTLMLIFDGTNWKETARSVN